MIEPIPSEEATARQSLGDPQQDYFADGITEALIADLAKIGALLVISRTSVMQHKGTRKLGSSLITPVADSSRPRFRP